MSAFSSVSEKSTLPYRSGVGIMLLNSEGRAFIGSRILQSEKISLTHTWQMPQGGIDPGEDPYQAALRELYEETGISSVEFLAEAPQWYTYDLPESLVLCIWGGQYRGQTQKWFALRFKGDEAEINLCPTMEGSTIKPEFSAWRWEEPARLPDLAVPFKKPLYEKVVSAFSHVRYST